MIFVLSDIINNFSLFDTYASKKPVHTYTLGEGLHTHWLCLLPNPFELINKICIINILTSGKCFNVNPIQVYVEGLSSSTV